MRRLSLLRHGIISRCRPAAWDSFSAGLRRELAFAESGPHPLIGVGGYVDFGFRRYLQFEAEGRWLRFNQYQNIYRTTT